MEYQDAVSKISEIHEHLTRAEVFRDYRALPVALSGAIALAAAMLQPYNMSAGHSAHFIFYWLTVAAISGLVAGSETIIKYLTRADARARRRTRIVLGQFLPCLAAGIIVTAALMPMWRAAVNWLPGLWVTLFSMGIFASRPYLPRAIGFVAFFYLLAGGVLLSLASLGMIAGPWWMGLSFGGGQLLAASVLYWNLERES